MRLEAEPAQLEVDLAHGARLASLELWGNEVLVTGHPDPIRWGCYPMAPWAGRVRHGRFAFGGREHRLPLTLGDHALHGSVFDAEWQAAGDGCEIDLTEPWPFPGRVAQRFQLEPDSLTVEMELNAEAPMPASLGWHPWFPRFVDGVPIVLEIEAEWMEERDAEGIPSGERLQRPFPSPTDDCLGGVTQPVVVRWPGIVEIELTSSCDYWVVYVEDPHAFAVEPQTHPPNALNSGPAVAEPGRPLAASMRWTWRRLA